MKYLVQKKDGASAARAVLLHILFSSSRCWVLFFLLFFFYNARITLHSRSGEIEGQSLAVQTR